MKLEKIAKLGLAAAPFLCLADMPYGYCQLVRFLAMLVFAFLSYTHFEKGDSSMSFLYGGLSLLFQPFLKTTLGRDMWNMIDVVLGVGLLITVFRSSSNLKAE